MNVFLRSFLIWLLFIPLAIANGAVRDLLLSPAVGELAGRAISSCTLSLLILGVTVALFERLGADTTPWLLMIGGLWLVMTVVLEFAFFVLTMGHPMDELLREYDIFGGRLWLLVLATTLFAPLLARWFWRHQYRKDNVRGTRS
jgi:hypothetical protein